jgi:2,3-bisphosphoglycerate-independent phosphoglycerate mutase
MVRSMSMTLTPHVHLERKGPVLVAVLDGVGVGAHDAYDAWHVAHTPHLDALMQVPGRYRTVRAHGTAVGLPSDDDMGNSEVGHNALGCGRVVTQGAALVDRALASGALFKGEGWGQVKAAFTSGGTLHLLGLLSDGGVHSRLDQVLKLIDGAVADGAKTIRLHVLTDGRDVPDQTADHYIAALEDHLRLVADKGVDARIASGGGRMHVTMDRYEADWRIVERGWRAHVLGDGPRYPSAQAAIAAMRADDPSASDQYLGPFVVEENGTPVGPIVDGDAVICFNFRGDRVIEISRAFEEQDFAPFVRERVPDVVYAGMMEYDGDLKIPSRSLVDPPDIDKTSGEYLVRAGVRTYAVSETHKFGHVTYFWNGNASGAFDDKLETYQEIESDPRPFVDAPEMKAGAITDAAIAALKSGRYDYVRLNIANGDMVGHTGDLEATIRACALVDEQVGRLVAAVNDVGGAFLITADHGNADDMVQRDKQGGVKMADGKPIPKTSHTLAPVPVCVGGPALGDGWRLRDDMADAGLANLTSTYVNLLGYEAPEGYADSLLAQKGG